MTVAAVRIVAIKEFRALIPVWLASVAALGLSTVWPGRLVNSLAVMAYFLGAIALGSLSMGHEYSHRTVPQLLSIPASRGRLFLLKLGVLTVLLLTLAAVAGYGAPREAWMVIGLPILAALFIAPCLTMLCRGTLPGIVFTAGVMGSIWVAAELLTVARYGVTAGRLAFTVDAFRYEMAAVCAIGALAGWRTFMRLEAIEGQGAEIHLPQWLAVGSDAGDPAPAIRRHPYWLLVYKELRLQQLSLVIAGLLIVEWTTVTILRGAVAGFTGPTFEVVTAFYSLILSVLIGSLASAEERQMGTLEWQMLLPVAAWQQWLVKVAATLGLVLALVVGLPVALMSIHPAHGDGHLNAPFAAIIIVSTIISVYVSSISASGIRALMGAIPVVAAVFLASLRVAGSVPVQTWWHVKVIVGPPGPVPGVLLLAGFLAVVLWLALENHRTAAPGATRVALHVSGMCGCLALGAAILSLL